VADCVAADVLLDHMGAAEILHGDKDYDTNAVRDKIESKGTAAPNIPPKANRRWKSGFSPYFYRNRNAIERMSSRLKDFRRIATRYDRLAQNLLAAVCLAAALCYWLGVMTLTQQGDGSPAQEYCAFGIGAVSFSQRARNACRRPCLHRQGDIRAVRH